MGAKEKTEGISLAPAEVRVIDEHDNELDYMLAMAAATPKKRWPKVLNRQGEHQARFLNAILPESYIQPHMHTNFHQEETSQAIRGVFDVLIFADDGEVANSIQVAGRKIVSIPPETWHTYISDIPFIMYVTTGQPEGGYDKKTHKIFPPWAPEEGTDEANTYLEELKAKIEQRR